MTTTSPRSANLSARTLHGRRHRSGGVLLAVLALAASSLVPLALASPAAASGAPFGAVATAFRIDGQNDANNVKLDWSGVSGAASYEILRDGSRIATTGGTSYDDYGLAVGHDYSYDVKALDVDGDILSASIDAPVTSYAPSGDYASYDNTQVSSLSLKSTLQVGGIYYRFDVQSDDDGFKQVVQKTSTDGYNFTGSDVVLTRASDPSLASAKLESVNFVKSPAGQIVMVAHYENNVDYSLAQLLIAVATPGQPFAVTYNAQPLGHDSRDITFFADGSTGYVLSATDNNSDLNVYELSADWSTPATLTTTLFAGQNREAPAMVKVDGTYYLFTSAAAGWYPSQPEYASATSIAGPWSELRPLGNTATFGAQSGGIVRIGDQYAMMANRWSMNWKYPEANNAQRMLPLSFNQGYAAFDWYESVDYDAASGSIVPVQHGQILSVGKPTKASGLSHDAAGEDVTYAASKADDGTQDDADNYFKSDTVPFSWEVDLQQAATLDHINLTTHLVNGSETYYQYTIQASIDDKSWTTIVDASANKLPGFMSHDIASDTPYRYVKINVSKVVNIQNGNEADWARGIDELTVYGTPTGQPAPDTVAQPSADVAAGTYYSPQTVTLTADAGATIYYTTDGSTPSASHGAAYTAPITVSESTDLKAIAVADGELDSEVLDLSYVIKAGDTPVALVNPVYAAAYAGQQPNLPAQVAVTTAGGDTRSADVTWDLDGYSFDNPYRSLTVYGSVDGGLTVSAQVETVPAADHSLKYFIDSGTAGATSPSFEGVKSLVGSALLNQVDDQASTSGSWGYVTSNGGLDGTRTSSTPNDKDSNGLYGKNSPSGAWLEYSLPNLPAGSYTLTTGHQEWWTGPRTITVSVTDASNTTSTVASGIVVGANSPYVKTRIATGTFVQPVDGPVTVNVYRSGGTEGPAIGWLAVAEGTVPVDTTPVVVSTPSGDVPAGTYKTAQTLTLSSATDGASIYYTTDGSDASRTNGTKYTGPITVDASETVKAVAFSNGVLSGQFQAAYDIEPVPADGYTTIPVGKTWYDTDGNSIQAHGGGFLQKGGWYYWVGENKSQNNAGFLGVSLYKSQDLKNWTYVKEILTPASSPELQDATVERPKLLYNAKTDTFVLWAHWETGGSYDASHLMVATSPTVDGSYTFLRDFRPGAGSVTTPDADPTYTGDDDKWGYGSRDFTVFQDPDSDDAYLVSTQDSSNMRLYKLSDDYTDVDWQDSYPLFQGDHREAPALVKVGDYYYLFTSSQSGWYANQAMYSYTDDISDPNSWSPLTPVGNNTTFYSQPTNIMTIQAADGHREYIYMGDRWNANALGSSSYVWLPLNIDADDPSQVSMDYHPVWNLGADGSISYPQEQLLSQDKPVIATQVDSDYPTTAANDGDLFNLNTSGDSTNYYEPSGVPYSWEVDLGTPSDLSRIDISWRSYNGSETYSGYTVWGSVDGTSWTRLIGNLANKTVGFTSDDLTGSYRYVRVDVSKVVNDHNGSEADWAAGLVEVQVYGSLPDTQAPSVGISLPAASGTGWYTSAPSARITAADFSAVRSIEYRIDGGEWRAYAAPVAIADGDHTVEARATDTAGNTSDPVSAHAKVDTVKPTATPAVSAARQLTIAAGDIGSGVASVEYSLADAAWTAYAGAVALGEQAVELRVRATDVAGNVGDPVALSVPAATGTGGTTPLPAPAQFVSTPKPKLSGTVAVGRKVTATVPAWAPKASSYSYQWYVSGKAVSGASKSAFTPTAKQAGARLVVKVTGHKAGYADTTVASASATILKVFKAAPAPKIKGTAAVGSRLTATAGSWSPKPGKVAYQWSASGKKIAGATKASYIIPAKLKGKKITVTVIATKPGYLKIAKSSKATAAVKATRAAKRRAV